MRNFLSIVVAVTAIVLPAVASAQTELKLNSALPESRGEAKLIQEWVDLANQSLDGEKITFYHSGALGIKEVDILRVLPGGETIQMAAIWPGYLSRDLPELAFSLPAGLYSDFDKAPTLYGAMTEIYQDFYDRFDLTLLGFIHPDSGDISVQCKEPINSIDDLKSKKVRVWERHHAETFGALGISAQVIPTAELYVAMQTGVVDCAVYSTRASTAISLYEVAPYSAYLFKYLTHPYGIVVANGVWNGLDAGEQTALQAAADQIDSKGLAVFQSGENQSVVDQAFVDAGGQILDPFSEEDQALFAETAREVWVELNADAGELAAANQQKIQMLMSQ